MPQGSRSRTCCTVFRRLARRRADAPRAGRADEWDVGVYNESFRNRIKDERWWCVRGGEQSDFPDGRYYHLGDNMLHRVGRAADRRTRKAWKELPGCPPALHRISSPAVVTLELG